MLDLMEMSSMEVYNELPDVGGASGSSNDLGGPTTGA
jgi:hypothetical protein